MSVDAELDCSVDVPLAVVGEEHLVWCHPESAAYLGVDPVIGLCVADLGTVEDDVEVAGQIVLVQFLSDRGCAVGEKRDPAAFATEMVDELNHLAIDGARMTQPLPRRLAATDTVTNPVDPVGPSDLAGDRRL